MKIFLRIIGYTGLGMVSLASFLGGGWITGAIVAGLCLSAVAIVEAVIRYGID